MNQHSGIVSFTEIPAVAQLLINEGSGGLDYYYDDIVVIILSAEADKDAIDCHHHHQGMQRAPWWKHGNVLIQYFRVEE